jgi:hypothetical protein
METVDGSRGKHARLLPEREQVVIFRKPLFADLRRTVADRVGKIERKIAAAQVEAKIGRLRHQGTSLRCCV